MTSQPSESKYGCPPWCQTDHAEQDRQEQYVDPVMDLRTHRHEVAAIDIPGSRGTARVDVSITDCLTDGTREGPLVSTWGAECMTPETAWELARAVGTAARFAGYEPGGVDPETQAAAERITAAVDAAVRLVDDLEGAVVQYHRGLMPVAHVRLIIQKYRERAAIDRSNDENQEERA